VPEDGGGLAARERASMPREGLGAREETSLKAATERSERNDSGGLDGAVYEVSIINHIPSHPITIN
jgi:hypothetical protein